MIHITKTRRYSHHNLTIYVIESHHSEYLDVRLTVFDTSTCRRLPSGVCRCIESSTKTLQEHHCSRCNPSKICVEPTEHFIVHNE